MTQEEKNVLLKDLCARLPYGVFCEGIIEDIDIDTDRYYDRKVKGVLSNIHSYHSICYATIGLVNECELETIKPYLFPLSSMTVEQRCKVRDLLPDKCEISFTNSEISFYGEDYHKITLEQLEKLFNLFNMWHIDYRGLIPMGLAIDATGLNIY